MNLSLPENIFNRLAEFFPYSYLFSSAKIPYNALAIIFNSKLCGCDFGSLFRSSMMARKKSIFFVLGLECSGANYRGLHPFLTALGNEPECFNDLRHVSPRQPGRSQIGSDIPDRIFGSKRIQSDVCITGLVIHGADGKNISRWLY